MRPEYVLTRGLRSKASRLSIVALGALTAVLAHPATHSTAWNHIKMLVATPSTIAATGSEGYLDKWIAPAVAPQITRTINAHPTDIPLQLAGALTTVGPEGQPTPDIKIARLQQLIKRYPNEPTLYAALLRYYTQGRVKFNGYDAVDFFAPPPMKVKVKPDSVSGSFGAPANHSVIVAQTRVVHRSAPTDLVAFDTACEAGERLDPVNGFFPVLHAVSLFEERRDSQAIACLEKAATCEQWQEYLRDEASGQIHLQEAAFGSINSITRISIDSQVLLPHYGVIRSAMRQALFVAALDEKAGRIEEGLKIRNSVRLIGSIMRADAPEVIGSQVGIAISNMSIARPGAAAEPQPDGHYNSDASKETARAKDTQKLFDTYLISHGHSDMVAKFNAERVAGVMTKKIIASGFAESPFNMQQIGRVVEANSIDSILVCSLLWLTVLGMLTLILQSISLTAALRNMAAGSRRATLVACLFFSATTAGFLLINETNAMILHFVGTTQSWFSTEIASDVPYTLRFIGQYYMVLIAATPLLVVYLAYAFTRVRHLPLRTGMVNGIKAAFVPAFSLLVLAYAIAVPLTVQQDTRLAKLSQRAFLGEGRELAGYAGVQWPGRTQ